jgi:hypothetical protein
MLFPLGDHSGLRAQYRLARAREVRNSTVCFLRSRTAIRQSRDIASCLPSGEKSGSRSLWPTVSLLRSCPALLTVQMDGGGDGALLGSAVEANAIRDLFQLQVGVQTQAMPGTRTRRSFVPSPATKPNLHFDEKTISQPGNHFGSTEGPGIRTESRRSPAPSEPMTYSWLEAPLVPSDVNLANTIRLPLESQVGLPSA